MKILALDLSLAHTGYCLWNGALEYGTFESGTRRDLERLDWIREQVAEFAKGAGLVIIEGFSFASKGSAVYEIGGLQYLVRMWLWKHDIPFVLVAPAQLKKFATGKGNAEKALVIREVFRRFGVLVDDDNAADAIVLAHIGRALVKEWTPTTAEQRAVVAEIGKRNPLFAQM